MQTALAQTGAAYLPVPLPPFVAGLAAGGEALPVWLACSATAAAGGAARPALVGGEAAEAAGSLPAGAVGGTSGDEAAGLASLSRSSAAAGG